jgi:hypothetical protein
VTIRESLEPSSGSVARPHAEVGLRRLPYPYRGMLAICSDLDETRDARTYVETARYLNTSRITEMGEGLGLEVGNTIYFDMPREQFAYWNTDDTGRAWVRSLIRSGHVDCLHSFGDLGTTRAHAARALEELGRFGCQLRVWVDHGSVPSNFGADIMSGSGDVPGSDSFHADLTCAHGVQFVWRGRVTSVIGQSTPRRLGGIFTVRHAVASARTLAKESLKGLLGSAGRNRYAPHGVNDTVWPVRLRSGHLVTEFIRSNPSWGGISHNDTGRGIGEVLTDIMLDRLEERQGIMILYTHLGKTGTVGALLPESSRLGLARLARRFHDSRILVATTRRVLSYCRAVRGVALCATRRADGTLIVDLRTNPRDGAPPVERGDLDGLTVYVPEPERTTILADGRVVTEIGSNPPDHTGRRSVSIPWTVLEFPEV